MFYLWKDVKVLLLVLSTYFQHEYVADRSQGFVSLGFLCSQKLKKLQFQMWQSLKLSVSCLSDSVLSQLTDNWEPEVRKSYVFWLQSMEQMPCFFNSYFVSHILAYPKSKSNTWPLSVCQHQWKKKDIDDNTVYLVSWVLKSKHREWKQVSNPSPILLHYLSKSKAWRQNSFLPKMNFHVFTLCFL